MLYAELSFSPTLLRRLCALSPFLSPALLVFGAYLMSYPQEDFLRAIWSRNLDFFIQHIAPRVHSNERFSVSLGAICLVAGIMISQRARCILSHRFPVWLGSVSYAIYLLHTTLMRTVLVNILLLGSKKEEHDLLWTGTVQKVQAYTLPGFWWSAISVSIFWAVLLACSQAWKVYVEPCFERITQQLQDWSRWSRRQLEPDQVSMEPSI
jgi:peptidoglycan/LPS O-acetylase OafA/YrhL